MADLPTPLARFVNIFIEVWRRLRDEIAHSPGEHPPLPEFDWNLHLAVMSQQRSGAAKAIAELNPKTTLAESLDVINRIFNTCVRVSDRHGYVGEGELCRREAEMREMSVLILTYLPGSDADSLLLFTDEPGAGGASPTRPAARKLLTGWHEIAAALDMKHNDREKIKSLNNRCEGPIKNQGKGTQPMVYSDELLKWWNRMAVQEKELSNRRKGKSLTAEAQHNYGRDGTVAPEIGGGIKKRRRRRLRQPGSEQPGSDTSPNVAGPHET
jgi:hypothetical protein